MPYYIEALMCEYDASGNRTSLLEKDVKISYKYDFLDRLVVAKVLNNSWATVKI